MKQFSNQQSRVFVVGLDGGTLELIEPWARAGKLPNLAELLLTGAFSELKSTIPPVTAPAWTSFFTGKNPGKHGIYDFVKLDTETYNLAYLNSEDCKSGTIWNILSRHGKKVCALNVPMTYPPHPVNGILITGMMTPGLDSEFVYPPDFQREMKRKFPEYMISAPAGSDMDEYFKSLKKMVHFRTELAKYLLSEQKWDFFMLVFNATDLVQHQFWGEMNNPSSKHANAILGIYQLVDRKIGELRSMLDEDTVFLIMSDHGAGPIKKQVHINRWLEENGYLEYSSFSKDNLLRKAVKKALVKAFILWRKHISSDMRNKIRRLSPKIQKFEVSRKIENIINLRFDWQNTKAYHAGTYANIRINKKGRERYGIVAPGEEYENLRDEIIENFQNLSDPETGEKVVERVFKKEEIYHGDELDDAPDMLIKWTEDAYWSDARFGKKSTQIFESQYKVPLLKSPISAVHKMNGTFIAAGQTISPHRIQKAEIIDIAPTILYLMGLPIPADMDGHALIDIFTEEFRKTRKIEFERERTVPRKKSEAIFSESDKKKVEERLRGIGYIG